MNALFAPVHGASLAVFRIFFGGVMLWEVQRYFARGWIDQYFVEPAYHFQYEWFEWIHPLDSSGMHAVFVVLGIASFMIMIGLFYRGAAVLFWLCFTYIFLIEQARYLNHFYLVSLLGFLLVFVPANRLYSVDALLRPKGNTVPRWTVFLIAFQVGAAYFFGGVAKLNSDWLLHAEPLRHWILDADFFPRGIDITAAAFFMSWSGLLLDLFAPFLLSIRFSRPFMYLAVLCFHMLNDRLFQIGMFPWFMIAASTIFFAPAWPVQFMCALKERLMLWISLTAALVAASISLYLHWKPGVVLPWIPAAAALLAGALIPWLFRQMRASASSAAADVLLDARFRYPVLGLLCLWCAVQCLIPLRHVVIPGNVSWTEEGHRFAWHMKLRDKSGSVRFFAYDPVNSRSTEINVAPLLKKWQLRKMEGSPHMIRSLARALGERFAMEGKGRLEVRVEAFASLNYRPGARLISPDVDLSRVDYSDFRRNDWILDLDPSLQPIAPSEH